jgi:acyl-CoA thioesterase I
MTRRVHSLLIVLTLLCVGFMIGCRRDAQQPSAGVSSDTAASAIDRRVTTTAPASTRPRIVVLGDSLTAGLGLSPSEAYPALLQEKVDAAHLSFEVSNAGVSGDTSAGGLSRLDWALDDHARILIVALGGNDGLRGLPVEELQVVLAGMEAPPNFGQSYVVSFHRVYPDLAAKYHVGLVPFLLKDVAGIERLNQRDGIHPTAEGARIVADTVWAVLRPMLGSS